jgi:hypothetical protein
MMSGCSGRDELSDPQRSIAPQAAERMAGGRCWKLRSAFDRFMRSRFCVSGDDLET